MKFLKKTRKCNEIHKGDHGANSMPARLFTSPAPLVGNLKARKMQRNRSSLKLKVSTHARMP